MESISNQTDNMKNIKTRSIAVRMTRQEVEHLDREICDYAKVSRSTAIKKGLKLYWKALRSKPPTTIIEKAAAVGETSKQTHEILKAKDHKLMKTVLGEGLQIHNKEGKVIKTITSVNGLFDFLQNDVFYEI